MKKIIIGLMLIMNIKPAQPNLQEYHATKKRLPCEQWKKEYHNNCTFASWSPQGEPSFNVIPLVTTATCDREYNQRLRMSGLVQVYNTSTGKNIPELEERIISIFSSAFRPDFKVVSYKLKFNQHRLKDLFKKVYDIIPDDESIKCNIMLVSYRTDTHFFEIVTVGNNIFALVNPRDGKLLYSVNNPLAEKKDLLNPSYARIQVESPVEFPILSLWGTQTLVQALYSYIVSAARSSYQSDVILSAPGIIKDFKYAWRKKSEGSKKYLIYNPMYEEDLKNLNGGGLFLQLLSNFSYIDRTGCGNTNTNTNFYYHYRNTSVQHWENFTFKSLLQSFKRLQKFIKKRNYTTPLDSHLLNSYLFPSDAQLAQLTLIIKEQKEMWSGYLNQMKEIMKKIQDEMVPSSSQPLLKDLDLSYNTIERYLQNCETIIQRDTLGFVDLLNSFSNDSFFLNRSSISCLKNYGIYQQSFTNIPVLTECRGNPEDVNPVSSYHFFYEPLDAYIIITFAQEAPGEKKIVSKDLLVEDIMKKSLDHKLYSQRFKRSPALTDTSGDADTTGELQKIHDSLVVRQQEMQQAIPRINQFLREQNKLLIEYTLDSKKIIDELNTKPGKQFSLKSQYVIREINAFLQHLFKSFNLNGVSEIDLDVLSKIAKNPEVYVHENISVLKGYELYIMGTHKDGRNLYFIRKVPPTQKSDTPASAGQQRTKTNGKGTSSATISSPSFVSRAIGDRLKGESRVPYPRAIPSVPAQETSEIREKKLSLARVSEV